MIDDIPVLDCEVHSGTSARRRNPVASRLAELVRPEIQTPELVLGSLHSTHARTCRYSLSGTCQRHSGATTEQYKLGSL